MILIVVKCNFAAMRILMVCLGNICRSPLAEGILQQKANAAHLNWQVESAGTNGYHNGEPPHVLSQKVAQMNGVDISQQRSRKFTTNDFNKFDKIYAMAYDVIIEMEDISGTQYQPEKVALLLDVLHPGENRDVPDPWSRTEQHYHAVYAMIEQACDAIIAKAIGKQ